MSRHLSIRFIIFVVLVLFFAVPAKETQAQTSKIQKEQVEACLVDTFEAITKEPQSILGHLAFFRILHRIAEGLQTDELNILLTKRKKIMDAAKRFVDTEDVENIMFRWFIPEDLLPGRYVISGTLPAERSATVDVVIETNGACKLVDVTIDGHSIVAILVGAIAEDLADAIDASDEAFAALYEVADAKQSE